MEVVGRRCQHLVVNRWLLGLGVHLCGDRLPAVGILLPARRTRACFCTRVVKAGRRHKIGRWWVGDSRFDQPPMLNASRSDRSAVSVPAFNWRACLRLLRFWLALYLWT